MVNVGGASYVRYALAGISDVGARKSTLDKSAFSVRDTRETERAIITLCLSMSFGGLLYHRRRRVNVTARSKAPEGGLANWMDTGVFMLLQNTGYSSISRTRSAQARAQAVGIINIKLLIILRASEMLESRMNSGFSGYSIRQHCEISTTLLRK